MTSGRKFANLSHRLLGGEQYLLITSELTNQSMRKALFTCVVYTNEHYSPPTEWIMHDPSKNKMASVNSHFRNQKSWEYKKYSTKIAVKFGLKVFKGEERLTNIQLSSSIRTCPWHSQISSIKAKPTTKSLFTQHWQKWILQGSLAETSSAIKQSIFMSLYKKTFSFPPKSCTHCLFSGWSFPKFSFQVKKKTLIERWIGFAADFWLRLLIWMLLKDHFAILWRGFSQRLTKFAMFENSVNSVVHASCRLHIFHTQTERSIRSALTVSFSSIVEITLCVYTKTIILVFLSE